ncbi:MAG: pyruvate kinase [Dethiobacteria bacterium]
MRRTKIVCTIGPATEEREILKELVVTGMDVARLNFSHGDHMEQRRRIELIRSVSKELGKRVAVLLDTKGPEIRIKKFKEGKVFLQEGSTFVLTTREVEGDEQQVSVTYENFPADVRPGATVLLDDGLIGLRVEKVDRKDVYCTVVHGGEIFDNKGVNLPGTEVNLPALSPKDVEDIKFGLMMEVDFIAASFIRHTKDILEIRRLIEEVRADTAIIAKIENQQGVDNFAEILDVADGIMIARGDLGVEIPAEDVPLVQKRIIQGCNEAGKPVITATQMLDSMIRNPRPTRAEASDVANAIFDGTDAVMLSGETAVGKYPVQAVKTMARIAERTEQALQYEAMLDYFEPALEKTVTDAISYATCHTAHKLGAKAIITATQSGHTARMVSKYKPRAQIIAVTPKERVATRLTLTWGVTPLLCPPTENTDEMFNAASEAALKAGLIEEGDLVVITAGVPVGVAGTTNLLRVFTVGKILIRGMGIGKKAVTGSVFVVDKTEKIKRIKEGQILVIRAVEREYIGDIERAAAIIAEEEGLTSATAIVGLNLGIPVIAGAKNATQILKDGETVTVDTVRGLVYRGNATIL